MDIVLIGTGNTATILGRKLRAAGHHIVQVYGRNAKAASDLALQLNAGSTHHLPLVTPTAGLYILAVSDSAIEEVVKELQLSDKTIVHTAGSVSREVLHGAKHYGVFYPLQSLKKETAYLPDTPIIIDASDEETLSVLRHLANSITENVVHADDEKRMKLHLAAVFTNNFVNYLYTLADEYCRTECIDFKLLIPLIEETALRIKTISPADAQTGPAARHDVATIQKQEQLLNDYPHLKKFYLLFTESIWNQKR